MTMPLHETAMTSSPARPQAERRRSTWLRLMRPRQAILAGDKLAESIGQRFEWCYFGTDLGCRERVAQSLGSTRRRRIGDELNHIAYRIRQAFSDWIAEIGEDQPDPICWWSSRFASKSPAQTDFFLLVCYAQLFHSWREQGGDQSVRIVVVEDAWLLRLLEQQARHDPTVQRAGSTSRGLLIDTLRWLVRIPLSVGYTWQWAVSSMLLARLYVARRPASPCATAQPATFLYTWIEPRCFASDRFHDPYTGRLGALLAGHGETVKRMIPPKVPRRLLLKLKPLSSDFVVTPREIRLRDIVRACASFFRIRHLDRHARFQGRDYRLLFRRELLREWGDPSFSFYYLSYLTMRRVAARWRDRVKLLIYTYENQPWEKLLCLAFRREAPATTLVAYQHTCVNPLWLNYFPGKREFVFAPMPDRIVANGRLSLKLLRDGGYPAGLLSDGGAFRYEYLFELAPRTSMAHGAGRVRRVLVVLPISSLHGSTLLRDLLDAFPSASLDDARGLSIEFILKCHPRTPIDALRPSSRPMPSWFRVSDAPLQQLLREADLYLYIPPTTTRWEAYVNGLPLVKYCDDFLDIDAVDAPGEELATPCSRDTLRSTLQNILAQPRQNDGPMGRQHVLERVFSPVDERLWTSLAQPHDGRSADPPAERVNPNPR